MRPTGGPPAPPRARWRGDALALVLPTALALGLFSFHLAGYATFLGDSDRLNGFLNVRKFEVENLRAGGLKAWSDFQFMGQSMYGLHYMVPDVFSRLEALFPLADLYRVAGFVTCGLLIAAAFAAYAFLKATCGDPFSASVGASLYVFSTHSILRLAEADSSFAILIFIPLGLLILRRSTRSNGAASFVALGAVLTYLLFFTFLQEAVYIVGLFGAYAMYRSVRLRSASPPLVFAGALFGALITASPRLYTVFEDLRLLDRPHFQWYPSPGELLRLFNDGIFGLGFEEVRASGNGALNLHEGILLYTSTFAALLVLAGLVRFRGQWLRLLRLEDEDLPFHAWTIVLVLLGILTAPGQWLIDVIFLHLSFLHARMCVMALLPLCTLAAVLLRELAGPRADAPITRRLALLIVAAPVAAGLVWSVNHVVPGALVEALGPPRPLPVDDRLAALPKEVIRTVWAALVFLLLLALSFALSGRSRPRLFVAYCLGLVLALHAFSYAFFTVNGAQAWSFPVPFRQNNLFMVKSDQLRIPEPDAVRAFHDRLEVDRYRSAMICDPSMFWIYCEPHVAFLWRLRLADGYSPGVPARLAALPWPASVRGPRAIVFQSGMPGPLLALLSVKYAIVVNPPLYYDLAGPTARGRLDARPEDVTIILNPFAVVPRHFFARAVQPVADLAEAADRVKKVVAAGPPTRIMDESVVEGFPVATRFAADGAIRASYRQDTIQIQVDTASEQRFLVLNEMYHPRWHAFAGEREIPVFATNAVMRGVVVPAGVSTVTLRFVPFISTRAGRLLSTGGLLLLPTGWWILRRRARPPGNSTAPATALRRQSARSRPATSLDLD